MSGSVVKDGEVDAGEIFGIPFGIPTFCVTAFVTPEQSAPNIATTPSATAASAAVTAAAESIHVASPFTRVIVDPSSSSPDAFASLKASSAPSTIGGTSDSRGPVKLIIIPTFISSAWAVPKPNVTRASTDIKILNILFSL